MKHQQHQQQQTGLTDRNASHAAICSVDSDAMTPVYRNQRGFAGGTAITRNGTGDYSVTLSQDYPMAAGVATQVAIGLTVLGGALHGGSVEVVSATVLRVRTYTVTAMPTVAAADLDWTLTLDVIGPN